ncbi:bola protein [Chaetomium sp. MPI-CAGE-AT-0009]|nr:bola protein [Chaetomium sp. MPI-CAGE-AT-0009]
MICRACLRARSPRSLLPSEARLSPGLMRTAQIRSLSTAAPNLQLAAAASRISRAQSPQQRTQRQPFSTSTPTASAAAQPQEPAVAPTGAPEKPTYLSEGESQIWDILMAEFAPTQLVVQDISGGCGSMYGIEVSSEKFRGLNMLKQQRLVNAALGDLMKEWHGVQLKTRVP